jgi:RHS repeat-associated protein
VQKYYFLGDRRLASRIDDAELTAQLFGGYRLGRRFDWGPPIQVGALVLLGGAVLLLLVRSGRSPVRVGVAVGASRALGSSLLVVAALVPSVLLFPRSASAWSCVPGGFLWHYHLDHLGSTQVTSEANGALLYQTRYRPYGDIRGRFTSLGNPTGLGEIHRREFTTYESQQESELQVAGARFYDPTVGQFLSHDPAGQFASPYAYGPWDPINTIDPTGESAGLVVALIAAAIAIASFVYTGVKTGEWGIATVQLVMSLITIGAGASLSITGAVAINTTRQAVFWGSVALAGAAYSGYTLYSSVDQGNVMGAVSSGVNLLLLAYGVYEGWQTDATASGQSQGQQTSLASQVGGFFKGIGRSLGDDLGSTFQGLVGWAYRIALAPYHLGRGLYGLATGDLNLAKSGALGFFSALVPGYGNFAVPNWPGGSILPSFANQLEQAAVAHDSAYGQLSPGASQTPADIALIRNAWTGPGIQPGPVGQVYRVLLTVGFGAKIAGQTALGR